tara:strand:+ start:218 stop:454 length:237 start_codon:yes stop_codon:yes gene_type:complete
MAITKTDAKLEALLVYVDSGNNVNVIARCNYALLDDSTDPDTILTRNRTGEFTVTNATSGEKTAIQSLIAKAKVIAVA